MSKKFKFELEGLMFELPVKFLKKTDWNGNPLPKAKINMNHVASASVVKQFVKKKYPNVVVSSKSSSFSGGNSVDVYISDKFGKPVDEIIAKDVNRFLTQFEYGKFNGMIDMYEYSNQNITTDNGTELDCGVKYGHVNNRAQFGTTADVVRMINDMMAGQYVFGKVSLEEAIVQSKRFGISDETINKALQLV